MLVRKIIAVLICIAIFFSTVSLVHAQVTGSVWTTYNNNPTDYSNQFAFGQTIYIFWSVSSGGPVHIIIVNNNGATIADLGTQISTQPATWQIPNNLASGIYYVVIPGQGYYPIAVASVYVTPESNWGSLTVTAAAFAAFGVFGIFKIKHRKLD